MIYRSEHIEVLNGPAGQGHVPVLIEILAELTVYINPLSTPGYKAYIGPVRNIIRQGGNDREILFRDTVVLVSFLGFK